MDALTFMLVAFGAIWLRKAVLRALHYLTGIPLMAVLFVGYGVLGALCGVTFAELKDAYLPDGRRSEDQWALGIMWLVIATALLMVGLITKIFFFR